MRPDDFADTWPTTTSDTLQHRHARHRAPHEDPDGLGAARGIVALVVITAAVAALGWGVWLLWPVGVAT